ncbi:MAG TPA: MetQ/NlpA family ABC transporter substrate-binding protein [Coleofasciculaceae cyanobacterium]
MDRRNISSHSSVHFSRLNRRYFLVAAGSFAVSTVFSSCTSSPSNDASSAKPSSSSPAVAQSGQSVTLKVGVSPVPHGEILKYVKDNLASAAGLNIDIVEFSDYVQPNLALNDKQLDANYFQHVPYMEDFGKQRGINMVSVVAVHIEPLGLYSKKLKSLSEVKDGATIAVPNDATNLGRSLKLLEANNLLKLKSGAAVGATKKDIDQNTKNLKLVELEAAQLPRSLEDTDLSIVNGNYAIEVGLNPSKDALALESAQNNPYANVLAVLQGRETDANIQKLGKLLTSPQVKQFINDKYKGAVIAAF